MGERQLTHAIGPSVFAAWVRNRGNCRMGGDILVMIVNVEICGDSKEEGAVHADLIRAVIAFFRCDLAWS